MALPFFASKGNQGKPIEPLLPLLSVVCLFPLCESVIVTVPPMTERPPATGPPTADINKTSQPSSTSAVPTTFLQSFSGSGGTIPTGYVKKNTGGQSSKNTHIYTAMCHACKCATRTLDRTHRVLLKAEKTSNDRVDWTGVYWTDSPSPRPSPSTDHPSSTQPADAAASPTPSPATQHAKKTGMTHSAGTYVCGVLSGTRSYSKRKG